MYIPRSTVKQGSCGSLALFVLFVTAGSCARRGSARPETERPALILARHGLSSFVPGVPQDIPPDPPLSREGRDQAARLGSLARRAGIAVVYSSPLRRAVETARIAADSAGAQVMVDPGLSEFNAGDLFGHDWSQSPWRERFDSLLAFPHLARPGGESGRDLFARVSRTVARLMGSHRSPVLVVAHGLVNRAAVAHLTGEALDRALQSRAQPNDMAYLIRQRPSGAISLDSVRY